MLELQGFPQCWALAAVVPLERKEGGEGSQGAREGLQHGVAAGGKGLWIWGPQVHFLNADDRAFASQAPLSQVPLGHLGFVHLGLCTWGLARGLSCVIVTVCSLRNLGLCEDGSQGWIWWMQEDVEDQKTKGTEPGNGNVKSSVA